MSGAQGRGPRRRGRGGLILPLVVDGEAVRGDRAPVATGSVEQGRRPGVRWAGQCNGLRPREAGGFSFFFSLLFLFLFLKLFCFSYFRPLRHFAKMLVHHQYYQKNMFHMMNILVFMSEHF